MGECELTMFDADLRNPQTRRLPGLFEAQADTLRRQLDESRGPADQRLKFAEYAPHLTEAGGTKSVPWPGKWSSSRR